MTSNPDNNRLVYQPNFLKHQERLVLNCPHCQEEVLNLIDNGLVGLKVSGELSLEYRCDNCGRTTIIRMSGKKLFVFYEENKKI